MSQPEAGESSALLHGPGKAAGQSGPPIATKAVNFFRAMGRMIASGGERVSEDDYRKRLAVCDECELRNWHTCTHPECGCNLLYKAALATEKCPLATEDFPLGKWPALPQE